MPGKILSPRLSELEAKFKENGGYFEKRRIGDIFHVGTGSLLGSDILKAGPTKRISVKSDNNGIIGSYETLLLPEARHFENFISVNFFGGVFYHPYCASVEMKVHTLKGRDFEFTHASGLYFASIIQKILVGQFSYGNQLSSSKLKEGEFFIDVPLDKNGNIAFDYMENYIRFLEAERIEELEAERIEELEAYLLVTGLSDYNLTQKEQEALEKFENAKNLAGGGGSPLHWKKYEILDIFDVKTSKSVDKGTLQLFSQQKQYHFVGRTSANNGVQGFLDALDFPANPKHTFSVIQIGENVAQFRDRDWYASQNIFVLTPLDPKIISCKHFFYSFYKYCFAYILRMILQLPYIKITQRIEDFSPNPKQYYGF